MILLTRLDKQQMYLNPDQIISVEETPDTVITLFNGNHFIVKERAHVIISRIVAFRSRIIRRAGSLPSKKYLSRSKHGLFVGIDTEKQEINPVKSDEKTLTPFHPQDF